MKITVQAHVTPWAPPQKVIFDEGLKLPIACVDQKAIIHLCNTWLSEVCDAAGLQFDITYSLKEHNGTTPPQEADT